MDADWASRGREGRSREASPSQKEDLDSIASRRLFQVSVGEFVDAVVKDL
jgi:hypothetical protein